METKKRKLWLKIPLIILASLLAVILIYVAYVVLSYQRIEDDQQLTIEGTAKGDKLRLGTDYTAVTYNIGFGAYTPDFTFFMDGGTQSWANSRESVINCIDKDIELLKEQNADLVLM